MTTILVDGSNVLIRAVRAMQSKGLTDSDGNPTGPLLAFIRSLNKVVKDSITPVDKLIVFFDVPGDSFRQELLPGYKGNRVKQDDQNWYDLTHQFLDAANICQWWQTGYEADDLIAAYVMRHPAEAIVIVSDDKDLHQLISANVIVHGSKAVLDEKHFLAKYGYLPKYHGRVKALMGDASDNIPGIKGVGPKKAVAALGAASWRITDAVEGYLGKPEQIRNAHTCWQVVDLLGEAPGVRERLMSALLPDDSDVGGDATFAPTQPNGGRQWDYLKTFLNSVGMESILTDYIAGQMWADPVQPTSGREGSLF